LYPRIVERGHEAILCTRTPYVKKKNSVFNGVRLKHVFAPRKKSLEAVFHTLASLITAWRYHPDIVHVHAIGPSLLIPVARMMGFKVVMTHHGPDYDRQKWGRAAKWVLKAGEYVGGRFANEVIVISRVIENIVAKRCGRPSNLIYNGVPMPVKCRSSGHLDRIGLVPGKYMLAVARFVPEKGLHDLIRAFQQVDGDWQLAIAGDADHETPYSVELKTAARADARIVLTGYVTGEYLNQLYSHAALFVLPSYHEGLPIVLLEAMSYGLPPLVSDIPANREVGLDSKYYFPCGDVDALKSRIAGFLRLPVGEAAKQGFQQTVAERYNWTRIAQQTIDVYKKVMKVKI
jgi:glycosyltransferase involved in cell wall biosynthesis